MKRFIVIMLLLSFITTSCFAHDAAGHYRDWNAAFGIEDNGSKKVVEPLWKSAQNVIDHYQNDYEALKTNFRWFNIGIRHRLLYHWGFNVNPATFEPLEKVVDECLDLYFKNNNPSEKNNPFKDLLNEIKKSLEPLLKQLKECPILSRNMLLDKLIKIIDFNKISEYTEKLGGLLKKGIEILKYGDEILKYANEIIKYAKPLLKWSKILLKFAQTNPLFFAFITIAENLAGIAKELATPLLNKVKEKAKIWIKRVKNNMDSRKLKEKTKFYSRLNAFQARNNRLLINQTKRVFNIDGARQYPNAIATLIHDIHLLGDHTTADKEDLLDLDSIYKDICKNGLDKLFKGEKTERLANIEKIYEKEIRIYRFSKFTMSHEAKAKRLLQIIGKYLPIILNERFKNTFKGVGITITEPTLIYSH